MTAASQVAAVMPNVSTRDPIGRFLILVLLVVAHRWLEMRTGWPDYFLLPVSAMLGLLLLNFLAFPRELRLGMRGWVANGVVAVLLATLIFVASG
jgi:hypothetical protein